MQTLLKNLIAEFNALTNKEKKALILHTTAIFVVICSFFIYTICIKMCPVFLLILFMFTCLDILVLMVLVVINEILE